ncbi:hypothetical protein ACFYPZ_40945 [Streptomyces sp. NPDC005506]|uniref:hypothetical protein n=1 Tax=unclassified Streptomyces TaxID=2593676 RepID=UPI00368D2C1E
MNANQKKLIAYVICLLASIIIGGAVALTVALFGGAALVVATAGGGSVLGLMGVGAKIIGPFAFNNDNAPPAERQREPS